MSRIRELLSLGLGALMVLGYLGSQWFYFQGRAPEYARLIDVPPVAMVSLVGLVGLVILALVDRAPQEDES